MSELPLGKVIVYQKDKSKSSSTGKKMEVYPRWRGTIDCHERSGKSFAKELNDFKRSGLIWSALILATYGIRELRVRWQNVNHRMLYFVHERRVGILSYSLTKADRVPPREIDRAIQNRDKYLQNPEQHSQKVDQ